MADSTVVYRGASLEDLPELARLRWNWRANDEQQADADLRRSYLGECERFLSDGLSSGWHYFVAADEDAIVASIFVLTIRKVPKPSAFADAYGYLTNVFVAQDRQRQGIGSGLLAYVGEWAKSQNLEMLVTWPSEEGERLYRGAGFQLADALEFEVRLHID